MCSYNRNVLFDLCDTAMSGTPAKVFFYTCYISFQRKGMNFVRAKSDPAVFLFFIFCSYEIRIRRDEALQDVL